MLMTCQFATPAYATNTIMSAYLHTPKDRARMLDSLWLPVMLCNRDLVIAYANEAMLSMLKRLEKSLSVPVVKIAGSALDIFCKKPQHQSEFLLGDEWISINATMLRDARGEFDGAFIDWTIITDQKLLCPPCNVMAMNATHSNAEPAPDVESF